MARTSAKVVQLNDIQKRSANSAMSAEETDEMRFLEDLRGLIWKEAGRPDGKWKDLAEKARLHHKTIQNFACGTTRRPQLFTIRRMCLAIDYTFAIQPKEKSKPVRRRVKK